MNKAKGTLVPERGWKYYILPTKVHPQTSFTEFGPRIRPQNSAPEFGPRIWPQNSAPEFGPRIRPQNSAPEFGPRIRPQNSAPEFGPSSVLGPGTCFKAYNLIQSQDAWLELKNECYKKLVKKFSSSSVLLTTRSAELKPSALKNTWKMLSWNYSSLYQTTSILNFWLGTNDAMRLLY